MKTREQWLQAGAKALAPTFAKAGSELSPVQVSVGWPRRARKHTIGQCWGKASAADGIPHIFISPALSGAVEVLATLAHELVHAVVGTECGHKGPFRVLALGIGLQGRMTATTPGDGLATRLEAIADKLGPYPHGKLTDSGKGKQSTRLIKVECAECGYVARTTAKWLTDVGPPYCGEVEHGPMIAVGKE